MYGIIVAMEEEKEEILKIIEEMEEKEIYGNCFYSGKIEGKKVVLVKSGIGKVNAARITQILIDKLKVKNIINVGTAGALNPFLNIGDVVIAEKLIQHDFDITAFDHDKGYITGVGDYIYSDRELVKELEIASNNIKDEKCKVITGVIASGDIFCTDIAMKNKIYSKFDAQCVEMEGAAIAQVCYLDNIPFVVLRSISDTPNGSNAMVFDKFVELASQRCARMLKEFLKD